MRQPEHERGEPLRLTPFLRPFSFRSPQPHPGLLLLPVRHALDAHGGVGGGDAGVARWVVPDAVDLGDVVRVLLAPARDLGSARSSKRSPSSTPGTTASSRASKPSVSATAALRWRRSFPSRRNGQKLTSTPSTIAWAPKSPRPPLHPRLSESSAGSYRPSASSQERTAAPSRPRRRRQRPLESQVARRDARRGWSAGPRATARGGRAPSTAR